MTRYGNPNPYDLTLYEVVFRVPGKGDRLVAYTGRSLLDIRRRLRGAAGAAIVRELPDGFCFAALKGARGYAADGYAVCFSGRTERQALAEGVLPALV